MKRNKDIYNTIKERMVNLPRTIITFMLIATFILPGAATKVSAASKGTKPASSDNYKPVVSVEEIPKVLEGLQELFKGCRWGSLEKGCNKTKDELVQAILDGYANMDMPYTMEERREALGLIPSDDPRVKGKVYIYTNRFNAGQCFGFAKFICYVLFGQEVKCDVNGGTDTNGYKCYQGAALEGFELRPGDLLYNKSYGTVNVHAGVVMDVKDGKVYIVEANVNNTNKGKRGSSCWINWNSRGYYYSTGRWYTNKHLVNTVIKGSGGYVMRYTFPDYEETPIQTTTDQGTYNQIDNEKKASNISLGINMTKVPEDVRIGQPIGLRGTVSSSNNIEYIYGAIIDIEGNFIQQTEDWPKNSKNVSVAPLNLNQRLLFDKLSEGYYTLYIYATDGYGSAVYTKSFKVGNPAPRCYGYSTVADGYYKIRTMGYKVLDVYNAGISNEDNVQIYDDGNAGNQVFLFTQQKDGSYTISPKHAPDKTLDVSGGYAQNGGNIQIYDKNGTLAQKFYLFDNGDGTFIIASAKNINCVLDVQDRKESTNYANIQVWDRHGDSNQRFFLERVN